MQAQGSQRIYFLDILRSFLMMYGVILHTARIYDPVQTWVIHANETNEFMRYIVMLSAPRMPAFFVISGFFCYFTLKKYNIKKFMRVRLERLIIPFLSAALTLNLAQAFLLDATGWHEFHFVQFFTQGEYIHHLWFLINLIVYFIFAGLLAAFLAKPTKMIGSFLHIISLRFPIFLVLSFMSIISIGIIGLNKLGVPIYESFPFNICSGYQLLRYAPYFIYGAVISMDSEVLDRFSSLYTMISMGVVTIIAYILQFAIPGENILNTIFLVFFEQIKIWFYIVILFFLFKNLLNYPSRKILYLSNASYTVYLFHHCIVIALGLLFIRYNVPPLLSFFTIITIVYAATLLIQEYVILRHYVFLYMYNGKRQ